MEWVDEAIIIQAKPHGETSLIVEVFGRNKGRARGLVRGGRSKQKRALHQVGHKVQAKWRGRLQEQLGQFSLEVLTPFSATILNEPAALSAMTSLCTLVRLLPEHDPHGQLYDGLLIVFEQLEDEHVWPGLFVRWELEFLKELGFGLDLSKCAATGQTDDLIYVSPKSGKAVSAPAGAPYANKLLKLPSFLLQNGELDQLTKTQVKQSVLEGLALTQFFLRKYIFEPREIGFPDSRANLEQRLRDQSS